jgi:SAM-dependent methyltransferase
MAAHFSMLGDLKRPLVMAGAPSFKRPVSQLVTASQIYEPECTEWFRKLGYGPIMDRKVWEYSYILHALHTYAKVGSGSRGLAFGCGMEHAISILAADGSSILATDYVPEQVGTWEARGLDDIFFEQYVSREEFDARVTFQHLDMNEIPDELTGFDFCWSTGSLEHIGGHANGLAFVENAMKCLKPGGIAVHTTEFTITSETVFQDDPELSFYCRADIEALAERLIAAGHMIVLNFERGNTVADLHVDTPPYHQGMTLCAHFGTHVISSIGLIIQKGA